MKYPIRDIADIVKGQWQQFRTDDDIEHLLLDSRRLIFPATSLFIALRGPRRDGRRFIDELYRRGVRNFLVERTHGRSPFEGTGGPEAAAIPDANIVIVPDTLMALQALAARHRRQFSIPVISITGSNGKTTVKEWLNQLLAADYNIVRSPKSYNSQIGVPLSVWQLEPAHQLAIFEAGVSRRGEMFSLEEILKPTIGIFTNIGEAHSEGFSNLAEKAAEKLQLFEGAEVLIHCGDQKESSKAIGKWKKDRSELHPDTPEIISWGRGHGNTLGLHEFETIEGATNISYTFGGIDGKLTLPFADHASIANAMHCLAACLWLRIPVKKIAARVAMLAPIAMRLELKAGINHCSVINDSYSADLSSLAIALDFLSQQQQHARRSVILSDILETGRLPQELYAEVARALQQKKVDRLIGIGSAISLHAAVIGEWFGGETVFFPTVAAFREDLHRLHFHDETILLKGARIFEFEEIDKWLTEQIHQTVMEVDLNAMAANLRAYRQLLQPATRVMAIVKAFAYGSGSFEIASLLQFHGVDYLGVAYADEGVALRRGGIRIPIMIMNTETSSFDSLVQYNLEPVIYSLPLLRTFDRWLKNEGIPAFPVHIELETGMNRLGFPATQWDELLQTLPESAFRVQSAFSHFAASEEAQQDDFSRGQAVAYLMAADRMEKALGYSFIRHMANSAGIVRHPHWQLDMVRLGIGLYGIDSANPLPPAKPHSAADDRLDLREVSTLKTTIAQIKNLHEGDTNGFIGRGLLHRERSLLPSASVTPMAIPVTWVMERVRCGSKTGWRLRSAASAWTLR